MLFFISLLFLLQDQEIPLKPRDEFSVGVDFKFKAHSVGSGSNTKIPINEYNTRPQGTYSGAKSPYIHLKITLLKLSATEVKAKVTNQERTTLYSKKVKEGGVIVLDVGFVEEMKDRATSTQYDCLFYSSTRKAVSRIQILIDKDGTYYVNGVRFGKF